MSARAGGKQDLLKTKQESSPSPSKRVSAVNQRMQKWQGQAQRRQSRHSSQDHSHEHSAERIGLKSPGRGLNSSRGSRAGSVKGANLPHTINTVVKKDPRKTSAPGQPQAH